MKMNLKVVILLVLVSGFLIVQPALAADIGATFYPGVTTAVPVPVISASAVPDNGPAPLTVQFKDTSIRTLYYWDWNFGDGSPHSFVRNPVHQYMIGGTYTVFLSTKDQFGTKTTPVKVATVTVASSPAPVANFTGAPRAGCSPLVVCFNDTTSGNITSWSWNFGDGSNSTLQNPCHTYTSPGIYNVSMTAIGPEGFSTRINADYITVSGAPVAGMNITVTNCSPFIIQCQDVSTGNPTSWLWDFGDGNQSALQNPTYTYSSVPNGPVTVSLTVANGCGNATAFQSVTPDCKITYPAKIKVTSTDGQFPIQGSAVYIAPFILVCAPPPMVGCAFFPDEGNMTFAGITDANGILSAAVPKGYVEIVANRTFSSEEPGCPNGGVMWTGKMTRFFDQPESVNVNLTDSIDIVCA